MLDFERKVDAYAGEHRLFPSHGKVLVALSGGGDSVALLYCLSRTADVLGITVEAAHLNHSLRGAESEEDETFCREVCARLGIPLTVERLAEGELRGADESVESAARSARRGFLGRIARQVNACRIATGHTCDDQAETVLQRLMRGTGPSGLAGILPVSENLWVRPLLGQTRRSAREYLDELGANFREDSTNRDTALFRNRIRHILLPFIESRFSSGIVGALARLADLSRLEEEYLAERLRESYQSCCTYEDSNKILLDGTRFAMYHTVMRSRIVRSCLERLEGGGRDTDREEVERILALIESGRGETDVTSRVRCGAGKGIIAFAVRSGGYDPVLIAIPGETAVPTGGLITARCLTASDRIDGRWCVLIDPEVVERYGALTVGRVKQGEYMIPFGRKTAVKVYTLLSDSAVPKVLRESVPVVRAGGVPVWIPGVRSAECLSTERAGADAMLLLYRGGPEWRQAIPGEK